jgi:hypothetical protein|tara:strand:+ start:670 stop:822 length:153 start_codon:yes stop_codon:yes gene_type:complete
MRQKVIDYLENPDKKVWADLTSEERRYIERVKGVVPKAAAKPAAKSSGKN